MQRLPTEVLLRVIELTAEPVVVAYPAAHVITRTLCSWALVSKFVTAIAFRELLVHCLYIDQSWRLNSLVELLERRFNPSSPNSDRCTNTLIKCLESLYLSPFSQDTINESPIVKNIDRLFGFLSANLRRLVIDMPLRSHYPEDDVDTRLRPILRRAFAGLTSIQEFISVRDELYLQTEIGFYVEPAVWSHWPELKHLALYNPAIDSPETIDAIERVPCLSTVVVMRADCIPDGIVAISERRSKQLDVLCVNTPYQHAIDLWRDEDEYRMMSTRLKEQTAGGERRDHFMKLYRVDVGPLLPDYDDDIERCQEWLRQNAVEGTLWSYPRTLLTL